MTQDLTFQEWLREHQCHLQDWPLQQLCLLAVSAGFKPSDVVKDVDGWLARSRRILALAERRVMWEKWTRAALAQKGFDYDIHD